MKKHLEPKIEQTSSSDQGERFQKQIDFILEADKLKRTLRQTILLDRSRNENSAEHSWHIALAVLILGEYAKDEDIDFLRVIQMLLVHDLVEIDAGDTYCYDEAGRENQAVREEAAANRIFSILPADQNTYFRTLWQEFESRETAESRFANALDRFQPFLHNYFTAGQVWRQNDIKDRQVAARMQPLDDGAPVLWQYVRALIGDAVAKGFLAKSH
jgi:putative hydrolase of HD superfamily